MKNPTMVLKTKKFDVPKVVLYKLKQKSLNFWGNRNWFNMARVLYIRTFILSPGGGGDLHMKLYGTCRFSGYHFSVQIPELSIKIDQKFLNGLGLFVEEK